MSAACSLTPLSPLSKLNTAMKASGYRCMFLSSIPFLKNSDSFTHSLSLCLVVMMTREQIWRRLPPPVIHALSGVCVCVWVQAAVSAGQSRFASKGHQVNRVINGCVQYPVE